MNASPQTKPEPLGVNKIVGQIEHIKVQIETAVNPSTDRNDHIFEIETKVCGFF